MLLYMKQPRSCHSENEKFHDIAKRKDSHVKMDTITPNTIRCRAILELTANILSELDSLV